MKASTPLALLAFLSIILATANISSTTGINNAIISNTTEVPADPKEAPTDTKKASSNTTESLYNNTEASTNTTQVPTNTTQAPSNTTQSPSNTTQAPTNTTQAPSNTTQAPSNTTQAPTNTTQAPSNTTQAPSNTTQAPTNTTQAPSNTTQAPTNTTQAPSNTTQAPTNTTQAPSSNSSAPAPQVTSSGPSNPCQSHPCEGGAACVELYNSSVCLCGEGYYYSPPSCLKGKTFPGEITVQVSETTGLDNNKSPNYKDLHDDITGFFQNIFNRSDYGQTVILKVSLSPSLSGRSEMRADEKLVNVSLVNILKEITNLTEERVTDIIKNAIKSIQNFVEYYEINLCEFYGCVNNDQGCSNSLQCECKPGLQRPTPLSHYCLPLACSEDCSAEFNKQCLKQENKLKCICLPGYQKDANENCQKCPFGYSGMDCEDQFKLILTIVGTIAAVLILGLLISLVFTARSKNKKNDIEEENLIDNDFQNLKLQSTGFSNLGADGSIFPKVRTSASKDIQAQNPYANQRSVPHRDY